MLVETYETPEVDEMGTVECEAEAIELIESLDLEGQRKLLKPTEDGETKRVPYPKVTKDQRIVIHAVCPVETKLHDYSDQAIPLRILQVAAHAKDLFEYLVVWHPENADEKDPYLIGCNGESWSSTREMYLLARWGEELLTWSEMVTKAGTLIRGKRLMRLKEIQSEVRAAIEATESADPEIAVNLSASPSYYN